MCGLHLCESYCGKAGTGCGGCEPLVKDIFALAMKESGKVVSTDVCEHFQHTRQELYDIVRVSLCDCDRRRVIT